MNNAKVGELNKKIAELTKQNLVLNRLRSKGCMDSVLFMQKSDEINQRISILRTQRRRLLKHDADVKMIAACRLLIGLIDKDTPYLTGFDEVLFHSIVAFLFQRLYFRISRKIRIDKEIGNFLLSPIIRFPARWPMRMLSLLIVPVSI